MFIFVMCKQNLVYVLKILLTLIYKYTYSSKIFEIILPDLRLINFRQSLCVFREALEPSSCFYQEY